MYYAFYYDDWQGELELRGLTPGKYQIKDYINNVVLGTVDASSATLTTKFKGYLLIELSPVVSK